MKKESAKEDRVSEFRSKLAGSDLTRYEIYITSGLKKDIKGIAKEEGLSTGVAAEALLKLGVEQYYQQQSQSKKDLHLGGALETPVFSSNESFAQGLSPQKLTGHFGSDASSASVNLISSSDRFKTSVDDSVLSDKDKKLTLRAYSDRIQKSEPKGDQVSEKVNRVMGGILERLENPKRSKKGT